MNSQRPSASEYGAFYANYISLVPDGNVVECLERQLQDVLSFWRTIPEASATAVHSPYTWNIRQVMDHLVDGERVFGYRLFRIARGDTTPLAGFDENTYALVSEEHPAPLADIVQSFEMLRRANLVFISNLSTTAWNRVGIANNFPISVRALVYILAGHILHHDAILRRRLAAQ